MTASEPSAFTTSQAQPEPKRVAPAFANASLKASKPPSSASIAAPRSPTGAPPPFGLSIFQKKAWLAWPPPLLRTAPCLSAGREAISESNSQIDLPSRSVPAMASFNFVM